MENDTFNVMSRQESILILPDNTLRLIDLPVVTEIYNAMGEKPNLTKTEMIHKLVCRKEKSLGSIYGVDQSILDGLVEANYSLYYKVAPRTNLYSVIDPLFFQKFVKKITVAFTDKNVSETNNKYHNIYYDNNYDSLVQMLADNDWTCLVLDDVLLFDKLTLDSRLNFSQKTVILSKIGYNYEYDKNSQLLYMKNVEDIKSRCEDVDIYTFNLFNFPKKE